MRDPVRFLNDSQKLECLEAAGYKCQGDGCRDPDLRGKDFEFHHEKQHSEGGVTSRFRTKVLCKPCHRRIHAVAMKDQFSESGWGSLRQWQRDALERFMESDAEKTFVLEAAPGSGKSRFAAFATRYVINSNLDIDHVIFIAPWVPILRSVKDNFHPLQLEVRDKFHYDKKSGVLQRTPNVDVTLDTYAGFCNQVTVDTIAEWQRSESFKFMLILDEIHHTNTVSGKWGASIEKIAGMAEKILVMSGTYFRSDNRPISFLTYEGNVPRTDYSIGVTECVANRYTRQVSFRFYDPELEVLNTLAGVSRTVKLSKIGKASKKQQSVAKNEVLDATLPHVKHMISEAWSELKAMRRKWPDAACLVVCRSGSSGEEERAIHAVESVVASVSGVEPVVVTSDDAASRGKIANFTDGSEPFLCAIRMVSEGVDIPRVRMVLFLSYTDSEMLFRQIVGRCARYIHGKEDDTAALVILPKFAIMADFAKRYEGENEAGVLNLTPIKEPGEEKEPCKICGCSPCECTCVNCGAKPCRCYVIIDSEAVLDGGQIASEDVEEQFIERAKILRDSCQAHQHANVVQLGDALQRSSRMGDNVLIESLNDRRHLAWKNVERKIRIISKHFYGGDIQAAWTNEVHLPHKANAAEIKSTWRVSQIDELHKTLKARIVEGFKNV
jgi:superfamily II DNA or RNA helicase